VSETIVGQTIWLRHTEDGDYAESNCDRMVYPLSTPLVVVLSLAWFLSIGRYERELGHSPIAAVFEKPLTVCGIFEDNPIGSAIWKRRLARNNSSFGCLGRDVVAQEVRPSFRGIKSGRGE